MSLSLKRSGDLTGAIRYLNRCLSTLLRGFQCERFEAAHVLALHLLVLKFSESSYHFIGNDLGIFPGFKPALLARGELCLKAGPRKKGRNKKVYIFNSAKQNPDMVINNRRKGQIEGFIFFLVSACVGSCRSKTLSERGLTSDKSSRKSEALG